MLEMINEIDELQFRVKEAAVTEEQLVAFQAEADNTWETMGEYEACVKYNMFLGLGYNDKETEEALFNCPVHGKDFRRVATKSKRYLK